MKTVGNQRPIYMSYMPKNRVFNVEFIRSEISIFSAHLSGVNITTR